MDTQGFSTRVCSNCGDEFFVYSVKQWLYKKRIKDKHYIFCSYKCREEWIKQKEKEQNKK